MEENRLKAYHELQIEMAILCPDLSSLILYEYIYYIKSTKKFVNRWDEVPE